MAAALVAGLPGGQAGIDGLASMLALQPQLEADLVKAAHAKFGNAGVQQAINKAQWQVQGTADGAVALAPAQAQATASAAGAAPEATAAAITTQVAGDDKLRAALTKKYGQRPKKYDGLFDGKDGPNEQPFVDALGPVVAQLNAVAEARGETYRFTAAEIATNFITEGGYLLLTDPNPAQGPLSGFGYLGIDTFMQRQPELTPWMSQDLKDWSADPAHAEPAVNELGESVQALNVRDLPMGVEANAVMFAAARERFSTDARAAKVPAAKLTEEAWFFWTTVYYNAGEGTGKKMLLKHGVDYWKTKYTGAENSQSAKYNATWRTSTWDYLRQHGGDDLAEMTE
jgi:hypothetical protein